jgi:hypothetical protein
MLVTLLSVVDYSTTQINYLIIELQPKNMAFVNWIKKSLGVFFLIHFKIYFLGEYH